MADGAGCGVSLCVFAASVYEWVGRWDGSREPWDDVVGEEAPAGWRTEQGVGFHCVFLRPRYTNGWADGMAVGNHGLGTRLSEMEGKLPAYPHIFRHHDVETAFLAEG